MEQLVKARTDIEEEAARVCCCGRKYYWSRPLKLHRGALVSRCYIKRMRRLCIPLR